MSANIYLLLLPGKTFDIFSYFMLVYDNQDFPEAAMKASWQARQFLISVEILSFYDKDLKALFFYCEKKPSWKF